MKQEVYRSINYLSVIDSIVKLKKFAPWWSTERSEYLDWKAEWPGRTSTCRWPRSPGRSSTTECPVWVAPRSRTPGEACCLPGGMKAFGRRWVRCRQDIWMKKRRVPISCFNVGCTYLMAQKRHIFSLFDSLCCSRIYSKIASTKKLLEILNYLVPWLHCVRYSQFY